MSRYYFVVSVWGAEFREYFSSLCLASLLAPGNVPALTSAGDDARLLVCTTPEDWEELQKDAIFQRAAEFFKLEFLELRMPVPEFLRPHLSQQRRRRGLSVPASEADWNAVTIQPNDVIGAAAFSELELIAKAIRAPLPAYTEYNTRIMFMTWGHKLGAERAIAEKCSLVLLAPDMLFADGAIQELKRSVGRGSKVVLTVTLRFDQDRCLEALRKANLLAAGHPVSIAPRDLVATAFQFMHIETACFEFDSPLFCENATSSLWRIPGDGGAVVYNLNYFPAVINFAAVTTHDMAANTTIDGHYIDRNFDFNTDIHIIDDSDHFFSISFTKQSQYYYPVRETWLKSSPLLGCHYKIYLLRKTLRGAMGNATKRHTYPIPVIYHSKPLTADCDRLIKRTRLIAKRAASPFGMRDYVFWVLERADLKVAGRVISRARRGIAKYLMYLGEAHRRLRRYSCALVCFSLALKIRPEDAGIWSRSVRARMEKGDFSGALKDVNTALSLSPYDLYLVEQRADVAQALQMWDAALADYDTAIAVRPGSKDLEKKRQAAYLASLKQPAIT